MTISRVALDPYGVGTPLPASAPALGPSGTRYLDPVTGDYAIDSATRQFTQSPSVRQRVLLAIRTLIDSSTVKPDSGIALPKRIGRTFEMEMQQAVRGALHHLTDVEKVASVDSIIVRVVSSGRAAVDIVFTDLTTGTQYAETLG